MCWNLDYYHIQQCIDTKQWTNEARIFHAHVFTISWKHNSYRVVRTTAIVGNLMMVPMKLIRLAPHIIGVWIFVYYMVATRATLCTLVWWLAATASDASWININESVYNIMCTRSECSKYINIYAKRQNYTGSQIHCLSSYTKIKYTRHNKAHTTSIPYLCFLYDCKDEHNVPTTKTTRNHATTHIQYRPDTPYYTCEARCEVA